MVILCYLIGLIDSDEDIHKEATKPRIQRDELDVKQVLQCLDGWCDIFSPSEELVSLSSGIVATEKVLYDLQTAYIKGNNAFQTFVEECLIKSTRDFHATIPKLKLHTFSKMLKPAGNLYIWICMFL